MSINLTATQRSTLERDYSANINTCPYYRTPEQELVRRELADKAFSRLPRTPISSPLQRIVRLILH